MRNASTGEERNTLIFGLLQQKQRWGLSWRGRIVATLLLLTAGAVVIRDVHSFLAISEGQAAAFLVVEGWIPDYGIQEVAREVGRGRFTGVIAVGGPLKAGVDLDPDDTYAHFAGKRMVRFGVPREAVAIVPAPGKQRDRTYASAVALCKWFDRTGSRPKVITVATLGAHARRTRLLFKRAFGKSTDVSVIAIKNREYDPDSWWRYSEGVKEVISEGAAYLYAKFLFHPDD